jgi:TRAP-type transport system periplasmic protein
MKTQLRALAALITLASAAPSFAQEVTLKFHHIWTPNAMASVRVIQPWCDKIAAESSGKMKCQILPSMSGGGTPPQLVDRVKDGVDDLVITLPGYTAGRFPAMEVFELPFMTRTAEPASRAAWDYLQKNALKEFPGTKILATWVHDEGFVHTREKQIKTAADFKGLKMRAPTRQTNKLLAALGATPVAMPMPATADALSKNTIDGMLFPWEIIPALKFQELVKFHSETDQSRGALYSAGFIFGMNQAKYDSLPADLKAIIDRNSGAAYSGQVGKIWDESAIAGKKAATDRGNTIYVIPPAEVDNFAAMTNPLYDEWVADMNKRGLNGKQLLDDARAMIAQHTKK